MNDTQAQKIVASVRDVYNTVTTPFIASRARDWSEFNILASYINNSIQVLDAGCAHGRLVPLFLKNGLKKENYTGIDISENLVQEARKTFPEIHFDIGNICTLPYQNNEFDLTVSSAVLHHIPSEKLRRQTLEELVRVTKPGGKIILLVWNAFYFKHLWPSIMASYIKSILTLNTHEAGDMRLTFFGKNNFRYVHAFTKKSLIRLAHKIPNIAFQVENRGKNYVLTISKKI